MGAFGLDVPPALNAGRDWNVHDKWLFAVYATVFVVHFRYDSWLFRS